MGKHLGKGLFSGVSEVISTFVKGVTPIIDSLDADRDRADLGKLIEAKFTTKDGDMPKTCMECTGGAPGVSFRVSDLGDLCNKDEEGGRDEQMDALFGSKIPMELSGSFTKTTLTSQIKIRPMHHPQNFNPIEFSPIQGVAVPPTMAAQSAWALLVAHLKNIRNVM